MKNDRIKIFICYAHEDTAHKGALEKVLKPLKRNDKRIDSWSDSKLQPGSKWKDEIRSKLNDCNLFLYLLSMHSRGSDACNEELTIALQEVRPVIMPIYVGPCDWEADTLIAELEMVPKKNGNLLAVTDPQWGGQDFAWTEVSKAIREAVDHIFEQRKATGDSEPENETGERSSVADERSEEANWNQARLVEWGDFSLLLGQFDQAVSIYTNIINDKPHAALLYHCHFNRGIAYARKDEFGPAIADFDEALELKPKFPKALYSRGTAYLGKDKFDSAIADFDEVLKLKPKFLEALGNRGAAYLGKGDFDRAITDLNEALELKPGDLKLLTNLGAARVGRSEFDRAIDDFDEVLKLKPDHFNALCKRGVAYLGKDELNQAIADFDEALKLKPDHFALLLYGGITYAMKIGRGQAIAEVEQVLRLRPDSLYALALLAQLKG